MQQAPLGEGSWKDVAILHMGVVRPKSRTKLKGRMEPRLSFQPRIAVMDVALLVSRVSAGLQLSTNVSIGNYQVS